MQPARRETRQRRDAAHPGDELNRSRSRRDAGDRAGGHERHRHRGDSHHSSSRKPTAQFIAIAISDVPVACLRPRPPNERGNDEEAAANSNQPGQQSNDKSLSGDKRERRRGWTRRSRGHVSHVCPAPRQHDACRDDDGEGENGQLFGARQPRGEARSDIRPQHRNHAKDECHLDPHMTQPPVSRRANEARGLTTARLIAIDSFAPKPSTYTKMGR